MSAQRTRARKQQAIFLGALLLLAGLGIGFYTLNKRQAALPAAPSRLVSHVMDEASIIAPDERARMLVELEALEASGGPQIVVATESRIQGASTADDGISRARHWKTGHAGRDDGVLLLIAERDHKARIEVGYGLEGVLTDAASRLIIEERMAPHLAVGRWTEAARAGLDGILAVLHPGPIEQSPRGKLYELGQTVGIALFGLVIVVIAIGALQAAVLAIPTVARRIGRSKRWGWFARVRIIGGSNNETSNSSSNPTEIGGKGGFGGGGAND